MNFIVRLISLNPKDTQNLINEKDPSDTKEKRKNQTDDSEHFSLLLLCESDNDANRTYDKADKAG